MGRKSRPEELGLIDQMKAIRLPVLGKTEDSVRKYLEAVKRTILSGLITEGTAKNLIAMASVQLRSIHQEKERGELNEWRELVKRAEIVDAIGRASEVEQRLHQERPLAPDGAGTVTSAEVGANRDQGPAPAAAPGR
jgi:hypothetical protein